MGISSRGRVTIRCERKNIQQIHTFGNVSRVNAILGKQFALGLGNCG
jgi:hypothetical protein